MTTETFPANICQGWNRLTLTNTPSYNGKELITTITGFIVEECWSCIQNKIFFLSY
jgi:hypothetical protein